MVLCYLFCSIGAWSIPFLAGLASWSGKAKVPLQSQCFDWLLFVLSLGAYFPQWSLLNRLGPSSGKQIVPFRSQCFGFPLFGSEPGHIFLIKQTILYYVRLKFGELKMPFQSQWSDFLFFRLGARAHIFSDRAVLYHLGQSSEELKVPFGSQRCDFPSFGSEPGQIFSLTGPSVEFHVIVRGAKSTVAESMLRFSIFWFRDRAHISVKQTI